MTEFGILSLGVYVPSLRLQRAAIAEANSWANPGLRARAKGSKVFANWDEDSLTMGLEAARDCLSSCRTQPRSLTFATVSAPFIDRPSSVVLAGALGLPDNTRTCDVGGSQRSASSALISLLLGDKTSPQLLVAADMRPAKPGSAQEMSFGAGASAVVVGPGRPLAVLRGHATIAKDFVSHFRTTGQPFEYHWEERWVRDEGIAKLVPQTLNAALIDAGIEASAVDHFIFPTVFAGMGKTVAKLSGLNPETVAETFLDQIGDAGNAHGLLVLDAVIAGSKPGEIIVLAGFGHGCDVLVLETTERSSEHVSNLSAVIANGKAETSYQKYLSFTGSIEMDWGIRSEFETKTALTAQYRYADDAASFSAGQCSRCGTIQFPRAEICVNANCDHVGPQDAVSLRDEEAEIFTYTADWLSFKECPPFCFGLVQFANGARALMEFSDFDPDDLAVGAPVRFVFRKKEIDHGRNYHSYFWKAAPLTAAETE